MMKTVAAIMKPGVVAQMFPDVGDELTPEIAGFGWFQGWNDGCSLNDTAAYETNMVNLIKDVRKEWNAPQLPVSIAVSGFDGFYDEESTREPKGCWDDNSSKITCDCKNDRGCRRLDIVLSQQAAANVNRHPELEGHVIAMETRGFWRDPQYSPNARQGYHFWHNAETYFLIGQAMASGMLKMMGEPMDNVLPAHLRARAAAILHPTAPIAGNTRPSVPGSGGSGWKDQCDASS
jgi:hypothetical protein